MQAIGSFSILSRTPIIRCSLETLQKIQHIVSIAPQEAQWFHTIEKRCAPDEPGQIEYVIDGVYIPEQFCSSAEVDSSPTMMVDFYKELAGQHGHLRATEIFANMGCWCHSHHNMAPAPSGQDVKQFKDLIETNIKQSNLKPVIMLIFNKRNEYYNRVFDPDTNSIFECVPLYTEEVIFDEISEEAKLKFKKRPVKKIFFGKTKGAGGALWGKSKPLYTPSTAIDTKAGKLQQTELGYTNDFMDYTHGAYDDVPSSVDNYAVDFVYETLEKHFPWGSYPVTTTDFRSLKTVPLKLHHQTAKKVLHGLGVTFEEGEVYYLYNLLKNVRDPKTYMDYDHAGSLSQMQILYQTEITTPFEEDLLRILKSGTHTLHSFINCLSTAINLRSGTLTERTCETYLKEHYEDTSEAAL